MRNIPERLDAHIHFAHPLSPETLVGFMDENHISQANLVLVPHRQRLTSVPEAMVAKAKYPGRFYVFTSLDVSEYYRHGKEVGKYMAAFVENMRRLGCDGLKLIEGKPNMRKIMPCPDFDDPAWDPLWDYAEKTGLPILWHVNDPESCWGKPEDAPRHIRMAGELYDDTFINNEVQYRQILNILDRHPNIKIIFAHLFFLSAQLPRLSEILDKYPNIMVDITPGLEIYVNLSKHPEEAKSFFEKYQDRIIYGTDIGARCVLATGSAPFDTREALARMDLIDGLFCGDTNRVMREDGAYLINTDDFTQRGFDLSPEIMAKIYGGNFRSFVGGDPAPVNPRLVKKECRRIRLMLKIMSFIDKGLTPDTSVAKDAIAFFNKKR